MTVQCNDSPTRETPSLLTLESRYEFVHLALIFDEQLDDQLDLHLIAHNLPQHTLLLIIVRNRNRNLHLGVTTTDISHQLIFSLIQFLAEPVE
jgi:hypothetical protein